MTRAVYSPATYVSNSDTTLTLSLPNPVHRDKCEQHRAAVEAALASSVGSPVTLDLVIAGGGGSGEPAPQPTTPSAQRRESIPDDEPIDPSHPAAQDTAATDTAAPDRAAPGIDAAASPETASQVPDEAQPTPPAPESPRRAAERHAAEAAANGTTPAGDDEPEVADAEIHVLPQDHEVDLTDLVDAPPESVKTPIDRLAEAFPGSELVSDTY